MGRENAFTLSGEPRRKKLITILFNLDFLKSVCYHEAIDTRRKGGALKGYMRLNKIKILFNQVEGNRSFSYSKSVLD